MFQLDQQDQSAVLTPAEVLNKSQDILNTFCPALSSEITEIMHNIQKFPDISSSEQFQLMELITAAEIFTTALAKEKIEDISIDEIFVDKYKSLFQNYPQIKKAADSIMRL